MCLAVAHEAVHAAEKLTKINQTICRSTPLRPRSLLLRHAARLWQHALLISLAPSLSSSAASLMLTEIYMSTLNGQFSLHIRSPCPVALAFTFTYAFTYAFTSFCRLPLAA